MRTKEKIIESIQDENKKLNARNVLEKIAFRHLEKKYGKISKYKPNSNRYWKIGDKVIRPYYHPNPLSILFINWISERIVRDIEKENAYYMGINYYKGDGKKFTIYFVHPAPLIKHYIDAGIEKKSGTSGWHIEIDRDENNLIFTRRNAEPAKVPIGKKNFYLRFEMTDDEYSVLESFLPEIKKKEVKPKTTLKVVVKGKQGSKEFSKNSALTIAILAILVKSNKPLTTEDICSELAQNAVMSLATNNTNAVTYALDNLTETGGIKVSKGSNRQRLYEISKSIKVKVTI